MEKQSNQTQADSAKELVRLASDFNRMLNILDTLDTNAINDVRSKREIVSLKLRCQLDTVLAENEILRRRVEGLTAELAKIDTGLHRASCKI